MTADSYGSAAERQKAVRNLKIAKPLERVEQVYPPGEEYVPYTVVYRSEEFTSVCPKTGLPDYATLEITYTPDKYLVELKSLKFYLNEYRNLGIFQEHVANKIFDDFWTAANPLYLKVFIHFGARGGIDTKAIVEKWKPVTNRTFSHQYPTLDTYIGN
jgi:7-cyano-7-deazaguanine reductase